MIDRTIEKNILADLKPNKVLVLLGARRTGKTVLIKKIAGQLGDRVLWMNGEDFSVRELLQRRSAEHYRSILGSREFLFIDEAQKIPGIGMILKLMVDEISDLSILVTGSSAFDIRSKLGEPLTGRKKTWHLYPISEEEYRQVEGPVEQAGRMRTRLVFGNYPELLHIQDPADKAQYLRELVNDYLLKDILAFENIRNSDKILSLLRLIAFQIGEEVSYHELGRQLSMSKNTVERYLDLLSRVFVIYKLGGFSRNLRKEVVKSSKWFFYDNGLRNVLAADFNSIEIRRDAGKLWENYALSERLKYQGYRKMIVNNYFWRTYDQQEIDWIEEREGQLHAYEIKWNPRKHSRPPAAWSKAYPEASFQVIRPDAFPQWVMG